MTKTLSRLALACLFLFADGIEAQDATPTKTLTLFTTGGFIAAIQSIAPLYEKTTGISLVIKESRPPAIRQRQSKICWRAVKKQML